MGSDAELHISSKLVFFIVAIGLLSGILLARNTHKSYFIDSFEGCQAAGYPIIETFPEQCVTKDRVFTSDEFVR